VTIGVEVSNRFREGSATDQFHCVERFADLRSYQLVDGDHAGVFEPGRNPRLG
jgi:hypothetical protein